MPFNIFQTFGKIERGTKVPLFFCLLAINLLYATIFTSLINLYDPKLLDNKIFHMEPLWRFSFGVIIAPPLETFIFQFLIIEILQHFKIKTNYILFISAFLFSIAHSYSWAYILAVALCGFIFATYYLYLKQKGKNAFLWVCALHAASNFVTFILGDVLGLS